MPIANLHPLIFGLDHSGLFVPIYLILFWGGGGCDIIFDLCLFDLHPLFQ